jgi:hypothetical protein
MQSKKEKAMMAKIHGATGYDVKAKKKVTIVNPHIVTLKNGRKMICGTSPLTKIKVCTFKVPK